jgi:hypothetical protein
MINRRYHFYFSSLVVVIPIVVYALLFGAALPIWLLGSESFSGSIDVVHDAMKDSRIGITILAIFTFLWVACLPSALLYLWKLGAFALSKAPEIGRRAKRILLLSFMMWRETCENLRKA